MDLPRFGDNPDDEDMQHINAAIAEKKVFDAYKLAGFTDEQAIDLIAKKAEGMFRVFMEQNPGATDVRREDFI